MNKLLVAALLGATLLTGAARANDTMSQLGVGGLEFLVTEEVSMDSEDLYVSPDKVDVTYTFTNTSKADVTALVAFPLPDITGDGDFMVAIPTEDQDNIFGFETTFAGKPVDSTLHQYVFAVGVEYTDLLTELNVPLLPFGEATIKALNALDAATQKKLMGLGLVIPMTYDSGNGEQTDYTPVWTLRSTYTWEATFPAGETVTVKHHYTPSVGGTVATTFLAPPYDETDENRPEIYKKKYCTDDGFIKTLKKSLKDKNDLYSAPYVETWLDYIWSTGGNWSGPIKSFHLTIDKGKPENLVSFCWDGKVKKTGPTIFEMEATDFWPPAGRELNVLILNHQDEQN